ncbi:glycerol kinase 5-like [Littorina saxatilis]|uniref:glycerol kinase 5-like n=1 Tax=Littorina saxatilis TaxID=31220 RepID=UPI0038B6024B
MSTKGGGDGGTSVKQELPPRHGEGDGQSIGYVLALDVGTTVMRGHVYDIKGHVKGASSMKLKIDHLKPGWFEIDPHKLFEDAKTVLQGSIKAAGITAGQVTCLGIATQRNTFVTWDRETGETFHNMITWQDLRAAEDVEQWNSSLTLKALNKGAGFAHFFTRRKRHLAASVLKFMSKQVTMRLRWVLDNFPKVRERACENKAMFGCIETWLLWKLTKGQIHATDYSCASATGIFDPFSVEWSPIVTGLVNIPMSMFPEIRDTSGDFGSTDPDIFGVAIPIRSIVADQQGAMFGQCCFQLGDVKCTLGTGTFLDINTGDKPHASVAGLYPLVAWKIGKDMTFMAEGHCSDTGNTMEWAQRIGLYDDVSETSAMASSVEDSDGVCFVPAFSGLQAPINDDTATTAMFGMTLATTKAHIVRAILDSLAFRFKDLYETVVLETKIPLSHIRVDGGVCNNDFLMQMMADVVSQDIDRSSHADMTSLGAAFLAGLASGVWQNKEELCAMRKSDKVFKPQPTWESIRDSYHLWKRALARSLEWYHP